MVSLLVESTRPKFEPHFEYRVGVPSEHRSHEFCRVVFEHLRGVFEGGVGHFVRSPSLLVTGFASVVVVFSSHLFISLHIDRDSHAIDVVTHCVAQGPRALNNSVILSRFYLQSCVCVHDLSAL